MQCPYKLGGNIKQMLNYSEEVPVKRFLKFFTMIMMKG